MSVDDWSIEVKLGCLIEHQKGFAFKSSEYEPSGHPVIRVSNFTDRSIDTSDCKFISPSKVKDFEAFTLNQGDVIIATVGSWPSNPASVVGKTICVPRDLDGALLNQNAVRLSSNRRINQKFLFHLLRTQDFQDYIVGTAQGSANQASITLKAIFDFTLNLPPLDEQKAIAHILGTLDDKIELNQQMNQTLEAIAHALFKSWFIDFDPVRAKLDGRQPAGMDAETAALFPAEFEDGGAIGKIPKGWSVLTLGEMGKVITGKTPSTKVTEYFGGDVPFITPSDMDGRKGIYETNRYLTKKGINAVKSALVPEGSIAVSCIGSDMGKVVYVVRDSVTNQQINSVVVSKEYSNEYLYYDLSSRKFELQNLAGGGSAVPILNKAHFSMIKILAPDSCLLKEFDKTVHSLTEQIFHNDRQTKNLASIRDALLPKLLSGEIRVQDAETVVERVV